MTMRFLWLEAAATFVRKLGEDVGSFAERKATIVALLTLAWVAGANMATAIAAAPDFDRTVKPLLEKHCHACHNAKPRERDVELTSFATADPLSVDVDRLQTWLEVVSERFVPPKETPHPLLAANRQQLVDGMRDRLERTAQTQPGDPHLRR